LGDFLPQNREIFGFCGLELKLFEQWLEEKPFHAGISFGFRTVPGGLDFFIESADKPELTDASAILNKAWGKYCYSEKGEPLEAVVAALLIEHKKTIAIAESCTGGRISSRMTGIPGSSRYFDSACVTYSNVSKERLLSVPRSLLKTKGAVSSEVAAVMAEGIRLKASVDLGLAVTGIAGPDGGSPEKPIGRVYIALSDSRQTKTKRHDFPGDRESVQSAATQMALDLVRRHLLFEAQTKKKAGDML